MYAHLALVNVTWFFPSWWTTRRKRCENHFSARTRIHIYTKNTQLAEWVIKCAIKPISGNQCRARRVWSPESSAYYDDLLILLNFFFSFPVIIITSNFTLYNFIIRKSSYGIFLEWINTRLILIAKQMVYFPLITVPACCADVVLINNQNEYREKWCLEL